MDEDDLVGFFKMLRRLRVGAVGGEHENMGIGAKTSLLPWNPLGVVVASVKDGVASDDPHSVRDAESGVYHLRQFDIGDGEVGLLPLTPTSTTTSSA